MTHWPQWTIGLALVLWVIGSSARWIAKQPAKDFNTSFVASVTIDGLFAGAVAVVLGYGGFWDVFK